MSETIVLRNDRTTAANHLSSAQYRHTDFDPRICTLIASFRRYLIQHAKRLWRSGDQRLLDQADIVQLTIIKGIENYERFRGETNAELACWLRQILTRQILSHRRQLSSLKETTISDATLAYLQSAPRKTLFRESDNLQEMGQSVRAAISRLPSHYREVVELHHFQKMSFVTIGKRKGKTSEAMRKIWGRAILRLRGQLKMQMDCDSGLAVAE